MPFVLETEFAKRYIANNYIETAVLKFVFLKSADRNIGRRIKLLCDSARNAVDLHTVKVGVFAYLVGQSAEEIADTTGRL